MKYAVLLTALLLTACNEANSESFRVLSYDELLHYQPSCALADKQLDQLHALQRAKHFDLDPDNLSEPDRLYDSRLKATIWWFAYKCNKS